MGTARKASPLLGESVAIERLRDFIVGVSLIPECVLLSGDSGTGKGLSAQKIHAVGRASRAPFIRVSIDRFRESELLCLLFGRSGGRRPFKGLLGSRSGTTCHLAGVEHMSPSLTDRLRDFLLEPLSPGRPRLVFTSRFDREELSRFVDREFLALISEYYMRIPPLRERIEDIPVLCRYQVWVNSSDGGYECRWRVFQEDCLADLLTYPWPGNVTELIGYMRAYCGAAEALHREKHIASDSVLPFSELYVEWKLRECYEEFLTLLRLEAQSGRNDLIFPPATRGKPRDHEN